VNQGVDPQQVAAEQQQQAAVEIQKANIKSQTDIEVARIKAMTEAALASAKNEVDAAFQQQTAQEQERANRENAAREDAKASAAGVQQQIEALTHLVAELSKPRVRVPVRDENGIITAIHEQAA
jgi:hypothetical protein